MSNGHETDTKSPCFRITCIILSSLFCNKKESSVSSGTLRKKIKLSDLDKQKKVAYLAAHMYIYFTMSIVPPLVFWFEMWNARGDNIMMFDVLGSWVNCMGQITN